MDDSVHELDSSRGFDFTNGEFIDAFQRLQIQLQRNESNIGELSTNKARRVPKAPDSGSATNLVQALEQDYGLQDSEIRGSMRTISSTITKIAHSITTEDFIFELPSSGIWKEHLDKVEITRKSQDNKNQTYMSSSTKNIQYCKIILGFSLWNPIFYDLKIQGHGNNLDSTTSSFAEKLLASYYDMDLPLSEFCKLYAISSAN